MIILNLTNHFTFVNKLINEDTCHASKCALRETKRESIEKKPNPQKEFMRTNKKKHEKGFTKNK